MLLCDEATSALDASTEKEIFGALQTLAKGRTSLFVAHRLSTAANCDQACTPNPAFPKALQNAPYMAPFLPACVHRNNSIEWAFLY